MVAVEWANTVHIVGISVVSAAVTTSAAQTTQIHDHSYMGVGLPGLKCQSAVFLLGAPRETLSPCLFQVLGVTCVPWRVTPPSTFTLALIGSALTLCCSDLSAVTSPSLTLSSVFLSHFKGARDDLCPTQIRPGNLFILRSVDQRP